MKYIKSRMLNEVIRTLVALSRDIAVIATVSLKLT